MTKKLKNIHWLFWGCVPIFLLYSFFTQAHIDMNIHDIMFVVATKYIARFFSFVFFITGLGYYLTYRSDKFKPVGTLTLLHAVLLFVGLGLLIFVPEYSYDLPVESAEEMMINHAKSELNFNLRLFGWFGIFIAQPILVINLTISIFRK